MILAGDIGGTKINLALYDWDKGRVDPIREDTVWTADYESLEEVLTEFLEEQTESDSDETLEEMDDSSTKSPPTESPLTAGCFGVPGLGWPFQWGKGTEGFKVSREWRY